MSPYGSRFDVVKGVCNDVEIELEPYEVSRCSVRKEAVKDVRVETEISRQLYAPVLSGQVIGTMHVYVGDKQIYELNICAANGIRQKEVWDYMKESLYKLIEILTIEFDIS